MLAASPDIANSTELNPQITRLIAVVALSIACFLHFVSGKFGLFMNKLLALFKTILLVTVFIAGYKAADQPNSGKAEWNEVHGPRKSIDVLAAMVLIAYSYQGWENANYVGRTYPLYIYLTDS
jgi:amino acid transporter